MRRKGVPCACDPCKGKNYVRAVNNVSPDPNGDLIIRGGNGIEVIQSGDDLIINNTANPNAFVAGNNIELNPSGDDIAIDLVDEPVVDGLTINGDLEVNGDIIQNGAAYETHAEKVYSEDDYIIMRDGAIAALSPGDFSGFQVKLYDGVNDGRLVIDNAGTARVGDVGNEQPLLTREESANLTDGAILKWDAANMKAVDEGTVGDDTHPLKSVNGVLTPVSNELAKKTDTYPKTASNKVISGFVFGTQAYQGLYMAFIGVPNANQRTWQLLGASVIGQADIWGSTQITTSDLGVYITCSDSRCAGKACNITVNIS